MAAVLGVPGDGNTWVRLHRHNDLLLRPFHFDDDLRAVYEGAWYAKFAGLLNPFVLVVGVVSLSMLLMHGPLG